MKDNILTVLYAKPVDTKRRMFFCPYTKGLTVRYAGQVKAILPGTDPKDTQFVAAATHRLPYDQDIQYTWQPVQTESVGVDFWIQDQYFMKEVIRTYHCFNCQMPQLYFAGNKTVMYGNKSDVKVGDAIKCQNPTCELKKNDIPLTFMGIVKIAPVSEYI